MGPEVSRIAVLIRMLANIMAVSVPANAASQGLVEKRLASTEMILKTTMATTACSEN